MNDESEKGKFVLGDKEDSKLEVRGGIFMMQGASLAVVAFSSRVDVRSVAEQVRS